jgi:hypothetical protein
MKSKQKYESRQRSTIITPAGEPMFCDGAITISIEDEGGGEFLVIEQEGVKIRVNTGDELELLISELRRMGELCRD